MSEYIEKEAAIKFIDNCLLHEDKLQGVEKETLLAVKKQIEAIPTADVRPVVRGKWIKLDMHRGMEQYKCSICQSECYVPECMGEPMYGYCPCCGADTNWCLYCGADMREDQP